MPATTPGSRRTRAGSTRARKGAGVHGGPKGTATAYFYDPSFQPYGGSWGAPFPPSRSCDQAPSPSPSAGPSGPPSALPIELADRCPDGGTHHRASADTVAHGEANPQADEAAANRAPGARDPGTGDARAGHPRAGHARTGHTDAPTLAAALTPAEA